METQEEKAERFDNGLISEDEAETKNQIQNPKEEDMFNYRFIGINPLYEEVEIFNITAGCEEDAFDLVNESCHNFENCFLLTDKMVKKLYDEIQKVKDII